MLPEGGRLVKTERGADRRRDATMGDIQGKKDGLAK
jgi:hypothetical protein